MIYKENKTNHLYIKDITFFMFICQQIGNYTPHRPQSQPSKIPLSLYLIQRKAVYLARLKHKT